MGKLGNKHVHSTMTRPSPLHCPIGVIDTPTADELWISPVYRRLGCGEKVHNVEIAHVTLTTPTYGTLTHHKTKISHGRPVYIILKSLALAVAEIFHWV